jgi:hypothetical protein
MDLARIALIAAVCLADGILLLLWNWLERARGRGLGSWTEILGNRWARGSAMCPPTESVRP